jgi:hypothetical protein
MQWREDVGTEDWRDRAVFVVRHATSSYLPSSSGTAPHYAVHVRRLSLKSEIPKSDYRIGWRRKDVTAKFVTKTYMNLPGSFFSGW